MSNLASPKGTHDLLPQDLATWQFVESTAKQVLQKACFQEIRTPLFESTELFQRGVGESTDIVNKEMYTFVKGDRSLTLRPENTAGVVRSYIQHGLDRWPKPVKLFYIGPMFRYERPQAGRQRQFHQLGVEIFGVDTPEADAFCIATAYELLSQLGLKGLQLEINNVGSFESRETFRESLRTALKPYYSQLCEDCQRRYEQNPLRMLDCKVETCKAIYASNDIQALLSKDNTCQDSQQHFQAVLKHLETAGIPYQINKMLVRGLDYYTKTVFELTSNHLGAQNAVCGGGRYNGLVKQLGGPDTPAVGWAMGLERLVSLLEAKTLTGPHCYIVSDTYEAASQLAKQVQSWGYTAEFDISGKAFGKQLAQAAKLQARFALILGESERATNTITVKNLSNGEQKAVSIEILSETLQNN